MATQILPVDQAFIDTSRYECVEGKLVGRPLPNDLHSDTQFAVTASLKQCVKRLGLVARQEWTLDEDNQPRHNWMTPDTLVASPQNSARNGHCLPPAVLAVEVLSEGQTYEDMFVKAERYFRWGVLFVWVIDPKAMSASVISADNPEGSSWFNNGRGVLTAGEIQVSVADIFSFED